MKTLFVCRECGATSPKWKGQCDDCTAWNSFIEEVSVKKDKRSLGFAANTSNHITQFNEIKCEEDVRLTTQLSELDHVLGGGLVLGSVVLLGGDPGIGKSTIILQSLVNFSQQMSTLYITGEESLQQVSLRAKRLNLKAEKLQLLTETNVERIIDIAKKHQPKVLVIDSIQTMFSSDIQSAPGSVSQVRESAQLLVRYAKQSQTALFIIGHVTKEGTLAGPRILEHMVDCVLYFESQNDSRYRIIRAVKNRFGAANEIGVFAMTESGLKSVTNPSAIFLSRNDSEANGSVAMATWEGSRPLLVEVQALVDESHLTNPRRVTVGMDHNRLAMLLAVLHRHSGIATYDQDVFVNIVGGVRVNETAIDLALLFAVVSSLRDKVLPRDLVIFGEVGLTGEIRPVPCGQERIMEAHKLGFQRAIIPALNQPKISPKSMEIMVVTNLSEAIQLL